MVWLILALVLFFAFPLVWFLLRFLGYYTVYKVQDMVELREELDD